MAAGLSVGRMRTKPSPVQRASGSAAARAQAAPRDELAERRAAGDGGAGEDEGVGVHALGGGDERDAAAHRVADDGERHAGVAAADLAGGGLGVGDERVDAGPLLAAGVGAEAALLEGVDGDAARGPGAGGVLEGEIARRRHSRAARGSPPAPGRGSARRGARARPRARASPAAAGARLGRRRGAADGAGGAAGEGERRGGGEEAGQGDRRQGQALPGRPAGRGLGGARTAC